jgi:hypothetical protein
MRVPQVTGILTHSTVIRDILIGVSLCLLIFEITVAFQVLGFFVVLLLPLPVFFYRLKLGRNPVSVIMALSFALIIALTKGVAFDMLYFGSLLMTGFFLDEFTEKHLSIEKTLIYTCLAILGTCFIVIAFYSFSVNQSIIALIMEYVAKNLELTLALYAEMGVEPDKIDTLSGSLKRIEMILLGILPAMSVIILTFTAWINILIIKKILTRKNIQLTHIENLNLWRAPDYMVWGVILLDVSIFLSLGTLKYFCINALMIVYFFQGIAVVSLIILKKKTPFYAQFFLQHNCSLTSIPAPGYRSWIL